MTVTVIVSRERVKLPVLQGALQAMSYRKSVVKKKTKKTVKR